MMYRMCVHRGSGCPFKSGGILSLAGMPVCNIPEQNYLLESPLLNNYLHVTPQVSPSYDVLHQMEYLDMVINEAMRMYPPGFV